MGLSWWDAALIVGVTVQTTVIAYLHNPRAKAFVLSLPLPFSLAVMALGRPLDATNVAGMVLFYLYLLAVWFLYSRCRAPIVLAIVASAVMYSVASGLLVPVIPPDNRVFWYAVGAAAVIFLLLYEFMPHRPEPGYSSSLPVYVKAPIIALVITAVVISKHYLLGFMTFFPMVSLVGAYETRYHLWTVCRQVNGFLLALLAMMSVMHLVYPVVGLGRALLVGWLALLPVLLLATHRLRKKDNLPGFDGQDDSEGGSPSDG